MVGILRATSRCESENSFFGDYFNKKLTSGILDVIRFFFKSTEAQRSFYR